MKAEIGERFLNITLSSGVVFHTTPTLLHSLHEHRVLPFTMIKEQRGNWKEVRDWFKRVMGWSLTFNDKKPLNIPNELDEIKRFRSSAFHPSIAQRVKNEKEA
jgi:hypothetical protein